MKRSATIIRPIRRSDLREVRQLLAQPVMDDCVNLSEAEAHGVLDHVCQIPGHSVYVAEIEGEIVGTFTPIRAASFAHGGPFRDVVVRSDRQGHGIGREMMELATNLAREAGCYKLVLSSGIQRDRAHTFYDGLGYERHGYSFLLRLTPSPE